MGQGDDDAADPGLGVGFAEPGEGGGAAGGDLVAPPHGDEDVVGELPEDVGDGGPEEHGPEAVMFGRVGRGVLDVVDGGEAGGEDVGGGEMDEAVEGYRGHDVDEEAGDFVEGVEDHTVAPHGDRDGVVAVGEAIGADEEAFRVGKEPDGANG